MSRRPLSSSYGSVLSASSRDQTEGAVVQCGFLFVFCLTTNNEYYLLWRGNCHVTSLTILPTPSLLLMVGRVICLLLKCVSTLIQADHCLTILFPQVIANDRLGRKGKLRCHSPVEGPADGSPVRVKCSPDDTVGDLKKLIAAQTGTDWKKIQLKKWCDPVLSSPTLITD